MSHKVGTKLKRKRNAVYIIYKGEEVVTHGTRVEIAEKLGIQPHTVNYLASKAYANRNKLINAMQAFFIGYDDEV